MLNRNEVERLNRILKSIMHERSEEISFADVTWLAYQLEGSNNSLSKLKEGKSNARNDDVIIKQAKGILITKYKMTEQQAHDFVRKTAMSTRSTKFQVAKKILEEVTS